MEEKKHILHKIRGASKFAKVVVAILVLSLFAGVSTGYALSKNNSDTLPGETPEQKEAAKTAQADHRTFKDFAEGKITLKPEKAGDYSEGTHLLEREGAVPVSLTSSVVDLSLYEGKKVRVYGETQKAIKAGWLMDVGRVDEI